MTLKYLRPILWTDKFEESLTFYTTILNFTCVERNDDWGWASLQRDNVEIMFAKPNAHTVFTTPSFTGSLYINTDKVEEIWEALKGKVTIVYDLETFPWQMREFAMYDNNGYIIQFGQDISL